MSLFKTQQQNTTDNLSDADVYELLGNERRIAVLHALAERNDQRLPELARCVAVKLYDDPNHREYKRVQVSLYQSHCQRLKHANVIRLDENNVVSRGELFDRVYSVLSGGRRVGLGFGF